MEGDVESESIGRDCCRRGEAGGRGGGVGGSKTARERAGRRREVEGFGRGLSRTRGGAGGSEEDMERKGRVEGGGSEAKGKQKRGEESERGGIETKA